MGVVGTCGFYYVCAFSYVASMYDSISTPACVACSSRLNSGRTRNPRKDPKPC